MILIILTVLLLVFKLTGIYALPYWAVFAPIWVSAAVLLAFGLVWFVFTASLVVLGTIFG